METEKRRWERLIGIVENSRVPSVFGECIKCCSPEKYWMVYALALSIAKWHPCRGDRRGTGECAVCLLIGKGTCEPCPAKMNGLVCSHKNHPYEKWLTCKESSHKEQNMYAQQIFEHLNVEYAKELKTTGFRKAIEEQKIRECFDALDRMKDPYALGCE